jgi:PAS domain S-box-containing protein
MKIRFTIRKKIIYGFLTLLVIFTANAIYTISTVYQVSLISEKSQQVVNPMTEALNDFVLLVNRSKMLVTNWVYLQTNEVDKQALKDLHNFEYPELKDKLEELAPRIESSADLPDMDSIFIRFESLLEVEKNLMNELVSFEDYEDPIKKFMAEETIESEVIPRSAILISLLENYNNVIANQKAETDLSMAKSSEQLIRTTIVLSIILLAIGLITAIYISQSITKPVNYLRNVVDRVGKGEMVEVDKSKVANDEIGDMASSVANMTSGFSEITRFAEDIGNGKYDVPFKPLSDEDMLGNALIEMRDNLKKVSEEDKKRNWATSGMAKFGEILRNYSNNFDKLADEIISNLVKYLEANQGALFIIENESDSDEPYMQLASCYAWDKKKFIEKKIYRGEGLSGQAWIEGGTIYLTEIPNEYISITSGLGEANPKSILIVPLKVNEDIHGVIEIAAFKAFDDYEIEFVERVSESIASTISSVKVNDRTQKLLEESTMMTEQMRAQEEEMRQNMEELQATQEKIQRDQLDREAREKIVLSDTVLFELSKNFTIRKTNELCKEVTGYSAHELEGKMFKDIVMSGTDLSEIQSKTGSGDYWAGYLKIKHRSGHEVVLMTAAGQMTDSINDDLMYVLYGKDVSNLVEKEAALS